MTFSENRDKKLFGRDVFGGCLLSLANSHQEIKPIIDALKTNDLAAVRTKLLQIKNKAEQGYRSVEGATYEGDDEGVRKKKTDFDALAQHFVRLNESEPVKKMRENTAKNAGEALLFLEAQPEDLDLNKILDLLKRSGHNF